MSAAGWLHVQQEAFERRWAETPWRCACGEKVLVEGRSCGECIARREDRRERVHCVRETIATVPPRYAWGAFEHTDLAARVRDSRAIAQARAAAANPQVDRISLFGVAGAGKTSLGVASMKRMAFERKLCGVYVDARVLSLARSQSRLGDEARAVSEALRAGILLLDDLGLDDPHQHGNAIVDVIYERHREARVTIVTVTIAPDEVASRYGDGFARRLLEDDGAVAVIEVRR